MGIPICTANPPPPMDYPGLVPPPPTIAPMCLRNLWLLPAVPCHAHSWTLQLISHLVSLGPDQAPNEQQGATLIVSHQEDEGVVGIEQLGAAQLLSPVDVLVKGVALCVPLEGSGMEHTGQVQVLLARHARQVSLVLVDSLGQAQSGQMFLWEHVVSEATGARLLHPNPPSTPPWKLL